MALPTGARTGWCMTRQRCGTGWVYRGMVPGGYTGRAIPGYYPATLLEEQARQRSGPRKACRAWSGWSGAADVPAARSGSRYHPPGPVGPPGPSLYLDPLECRLLAYRARLTSYSSKVSQNSEVSPKYVEKASHSPYLQNGLKKSPLGFLRFPLLLAFSPKELMGHI